MAERDHLQGPQPGEDPKARVDRELIELLNEVRIALPGVQVLFGFLLAVPFQQKFESITRIQEAVYFVAFLTAALSTALLIAPSSYHRLRFREGDKERMLFSSNRMVIAGLGLLALSMTGAVYLITDLVFGIPAASVLTGLIAGWFVWFWYGLPLSRRLSPSSQWPYGRTPASRSAG